MQPLAVAALVLSMLGFGFALVLARRESRVSDLFSAARIATALIAIAALSVLTGVGTPMWMIVVAVAVGLTVGLFEGRNLKVRVAGNAVLSRRTWVGVAVFTAGLTLIQIASIADSYRFVEIGLAVTWFSAALTLGVIFGRRRPIAETRHRTTVGAGTATIIGWIVAGAAVMTLTAITAATAQTPSVLDEIADGTYEATFSNFEFRSSITVLSSSGTLTKTGDTIAWSWSIQWEQALVDCAYQDRDSWSGSEIVLIDPTFVNVIGDRVFEVDLASTCGVPSGDIPSSYPRQLRLDLVGSELQGNIGVGQISFPIVLVDAAAAEPAPPIEEGAGTDNSTADDTTTTVDETTVEPVTTSEQEGDVEETTAQDGIDDADPLDDDESISPGEAAAAGLAAVGLAAATAAISMAGVQSPANEDLPTDEPTVADDTTDEPPSDETTDGATPEAAAVAAAAAAREARMEDMRRRGAEREAQRQEDEARRDEQARADQAMEDGISGLSAARAAAALTLIAEVQAIPAPLREVLGAAASPHSRDIAEALTQMYPGQGTRVLDGVADVLRASHPAGAALTATINNGERLVAWAEMRRASVGVMSDMVGKGLGAIGLLFDIERGLRRGSAIAESISPREIIGETLDGYAIVSQPDVSQVIAGTIIGGAHVAAHFVATKNPLVLIPDMVINYASGGRLSIDAAFTTIEDATISGIVAVSESLGVRFAQWWDQ